MRPLPTGCYGSHTTSPDGTQSEAFPRRHLSAGTWQDVRCCPRATHHRLHSSLVIQLLDMIFFVTFHFRSCLHSIFDTTYLTIAFPNLVAFVYKSCTVCYGSLV